MGQDGEHIWLRQAATFTVNGETRTVEIAVPLRPGATPEEIETLLREADGGMDRLSRHLDARVAVLRGEAPAAVEAPAQVEAPAPVPAAPAPVAAAPVAPAAPTPAPARHEPVEEEAEEDEDEIFAAPAPRAEEPRLRPAAPSRPEPTPAPAAPSRERGGLSLVREPAAAAQPASPPAPRPSAPPAPVAAPAAPVSSAPMTLQEFLKETQDEFGFTPRTVMEKLGVRSLSGVNYREALETLRRQALRDGTMHPAAPSEPSRAPAAPAQPPRYFEEELDEPEIVFSASDEDAPYGDEFGASEGEDEVFDELELEEEELPPPPPPPAAPTRASSATRTRASAQSQAPVAPPAPPADPVDEESARVAGLIAQLREPQAGGVPTSHQRTAYRNIVVQELGDEKSKALVAGLYRVTPERIGPEQIDALVSWGKRDTFADDADVVLAALRAERAAQQAAQQAEEAAPPSAERPAPRASRAPRS